MQIALLPQRQIEDEEEIVHYHGGDFNKLRHTRRIGCVQNINYYELDLDDDPSLRGGCRNQGL